MLDSHIRELAERSKARKIFTYTDFISPQMQAEISATYKIGEVTMWGGADFAERKMVRFGDDACFGEDFPLCILKITVNGAKFGKPLTHRDVLGSITALGVERSKIGDIFVGKEIYAAVANTVAAYLVDELTQISKSAVKAETVKEIDGAFAPKLESVSVTAQSNRLDAIISKLYNTSREEAAKLVELGKVFVNGANCDKSSRPLKIGETVSVRGYGKFRFEGENGQSRKGKTYFLLNVYK